MTGWRAGASPEARAASPARSGGTRRPLFGFNRSGSGQRQIPARENVADTFSEPALTRIISWTRKFHSTSSVPLCQPVHHRVQRTDPAGDEARLLLKDVAALQRRDVPVAAVEVAHLGFGHGERRAMFFVVFRAADTPA